MTYYENDIYPIALVLSNDMESVRKEYWWYNRESCEEIPSTDNTNEATTFLMMRKPDKRAIAVGIVFNVPITAKLAAHEGFHAAHFTMNQLAMPLDDCSDEAWAYLIGWIADCIDNFRKEEED